jgi:hypothetical protein
LWVWFQHMNWVGGGTQNNIQSIASTYRYIPKRNACRHAAKDKCNNVHKNILEIMAKNNYQLHTYHNRFIPWNITQQQKSLYSMSMILNKKKS